MSTNQDAVSPLRRRLIEDMTIRHLTAKTQGDYIRHVRAFAVFLRRSPDLAEPEDLRRFQLHMAPRDRGYPEPARRRLPAPSRRASGPRPAQGDLGHPGGACQRLRSAKLSGVAERRAAARRHSAAMSRAAPTAPTRPSPTIPAETGTARSARARRPSAG